VTPEAPKKIPAWIRNLRSQVQVLNSEGLIRVIAGPMQWDRLELEVKPFEIQLLLNTVSEALAVTMYFGSVSDTSEVENIFDELPFPPIEVMYNLEPVSKLWIFRELYLSESTSKLEIFNFLKECTMISIVGLQELIAKDKLVAPDESLLAVYGLNKGQRNWGNVQDSDKLLSGIGF
jgi:hypothetical protein